MGRRGYVGPLLTIALPIIILLLLNSPLSLLASLLDPYSGIWTEQGRGDLSGKLELALRGLKAPVVISFDAYMVPYIFASDERDAYFAVGFLHGYYRLWQMDVQRRLAEGKLAEVLGKEALRSDIYMRTVGLARSANATAAWLKVNFPEVYAALQAYSEGVNEAEQLLIRDDSLPLMFKLLSYRPDPWTPEDSLAWAKYMSWSLTNFWNPLLLTRLAAALGDEDVNTLFPVHPYYHDNVTVMPGDGTVQSPNLPGQEIRLNQDPYRLRRLDWLSGWATGIDLSNPLVSDQLKEAIDSILELAGEVPRSLGSNDWAVGPGKSSEGVAMMADDPHLALTLPSLWYELYENAPGLRLHGVTLPGIPFVLIGSNEHIAWGLTNTQMGVMDFYAEKLSDNRSLYYYRGRWLPLVTLTERIKVKGSPDYILRVNSTVHGPILSSRGYPISFRWTGNAGFDNMSSGITREAAAIYYVNRARGYMDLIEALRFWDVPSQNFAFADREGHFGVIVPGLFPYRTVTLPDGSNVRVEGSRSVLNGTGGFEWQGYIPFDMLPRAIDPPRGFVAAPNQMSVGPYYPFFVLGAWWDPVGRAQRIFELLSSRPKLAPQDMMSFQSDTYNWYAAALTPLLLESLKGSNLTALQRLAKEALSGWDYQMRANETAPTIWWAWFSELYDYMLRDHYKAHGLSYRYYPYPETIVWLSLNEPSSKWFKGSVREAYVAAFTRAIDTLGELLGTSMANWTWGRVHQLLLSHPSGIPVLGAGPIPEDGGEDVLMSAPMPYDLSALSSPTYVRTGPSWRLVAVMSSTPQLFGIYPGGQTENPLSAHYKDLVPLWLSYRYRPLPMPLSVDQISEIAASLILMPGG